MLAEPEYDISAVGFFSFLNEYYHIHQAQVNKELEKFVNLLN